MAINALHHRHQNAVAVVTYDPFLMETNTLFILMVKDGWISEQEMNIIVVYAILETMHHGRSVYWISEC